MTTQFEYNNEEFTKKEYHIGGITTYVYNEEKLAPYVTSLLQQDHKPKDIPIHILYVLHGRGDDYKYSESIAYNILNQYYSKKDVTVPLVAVAFDLRNHGERKADDVKNQGFAKNSTHAIDLISSIDGNVADLKLLIDFLPSYLNLERLIDPSLKDLNIKIDYKNIISGVSLGGHIIYRFASQYPDHVDIINPIIGCMDLSSLLINRLLQTDIDSPDYDKKWFYYKYDELPLSITQKEENYPEAFHNYVSNADLKIWENFDKNKMKLFATFGGKDTLVPPKLSTFWIQAYLCGESEIFTQEETGHDCTPEMIDAFTTWLSKTL